MAALPEPGRSVDVTWTSAGSPAATSGGPHLEGVGKLLRHSGRDDALGWGSAPSLRIGSWGRYQFRMACDVGLRTVSVRAHQPHPTAARPRLVVRANVAIGVPVDLATTADSGDGWMLLTIAFEAVEAGGVVVELWNPQPGAIPCWFDDLAIT